MEENRVNEPAGPFYTVLALFGELRKESKALHHGPGDTVAYLRYGDENGHDGPRIVYGIVSKTSSGPDGIRYDIMDRSDNVYPNVGPAYLARI